MARTTLHAFVKHRILADYPDIERDDILAALAFAARPSRVRSFDRRLCDLSEGDDRVVISKDGDFIDSFLVQRRPPRPVHVSTGTITNLQLEDLLLMHEAGIVEAFGHARHLELCQRGLIVHE